MWHTPRVPGRILFSPRDRGPTGSRRSSHRRRSAVFRLERLEDRTVLSSLLVTSGADSGPGTLRQAILVAADGETITFAKKVHTITLTSGELAIGKGLDIEGPGANELTISGNDQSRVFDVSTGVTVTIAGLTIAGGRADQNATPFPGMGGGILNQGNLTLTGDVVSDNRAVGYNDVNYNYGHAEGGGVANFGTLNVAGSTFIANQALGAKDSTGGSVSKGGGIDFPGLGLGGGLDNEPNASATITDSGFIGNLAQGGSDCSGTFAGLGQGGAIYSDANLTLTRSLLSGNRAIGGDNTNSDLYSGDGVGGGISSGNHTALTNPGGTSAVLTVSQSAFIGNQAVGGNNNRVLLPLKYVEPVSGPSNGFGGGIFVFQGGATISQSTLGYNLAHGGAGGGGQKGSLGVGGGILFANFIGGVDGSVEGCAIVQNAAIGGPGVSGGAGLGGGLAAGGLGGSGFSAPGTVAVSDTLVAGNLAQGGNGGTDSNGGDGLGGGVYNDADSEMTVTHSSIMFNLAVGGQGQGAGLDGQGIGGGVYNIGTFSFDSNTVIKKNRASTSNPDIYSTH